MATASKTTTEPAHCVKCGCADGSNLKLIIDNECDTFQCTYCDDTFTVNEITEQIAALQKLVKVATAARAIMQAN